MATYNNIEEYRRKKKRRRVLRNLLIVLILLAVLSLVLWGAAYFRGSSLEDKITGGLDTQQQFPLTISRELLMDILPFGDGFAVLSKSSVLTYDSNAKRGQTISHGYTNPVLKANGKRLLTYDRGGSKFRVDTYGGAVGEITTESAILCAALAPNGSVAVAMSYRSNVPVVVVYDSNLNVTYRYSTTEEYSTIAFSSDSSRLLLSEVTTQKGILSAALFELDLSTETEAAVTEVSDVLPLSAVYASNHVVLVGMEGVVSLDANRTATRWECQGELQNFTVAPNGTVIFVNHDPLSAESVVTAISPEGKELGQAEPQEDILAVSSDGSRTLVLGKRTLFIYDSAMKLVEQKELEQTFIQVAQNGNTAYLLSEDGVDRIRF